MSNTLALGPWPDGLNLTSNRDRSVYLRPTELSEATNVVITPEGFIEPRPGCKMVTSDILYEHLKGNATLTILGSVKLPDSTIVAFVQVHHSGTSYVYKVFSPTNISFYFSAPGSRFSHVLMHTGITDHSGIIFFADEINKSYVTPDYSLTTVPTLIPSTNAVPGSTGGLIVKDRLFLYEGRTSKFMWSPATNILDWSKVDDPDTVGVDVAGHEFIERTIPTDGIMCIAFLNNSFYIFKKNKTYLFTYQNIPADDAYLRKISTEFGALDCTTYRGTIVVFNGKGVFRVDGTEFIDLQAQLNLRFELPVDHNSIEPDDVFITDFNNNLLIGYCDVNSRFEYPDMLWNDVWDDTWENFDYTKADNSYYCMNGYSGAWTKWDYTYADLPNLKNYIASPGSQGYLAQEIRSTVQTLFFASFDRSRLVYMEWKPVKTVDTTSNFNLDSNISSPTIPLTTLYIPKVKIATKASIGGSMLNYKKIYRTFIRFYLSDQPINPNTPFKALWTASINYNDYKFSSDKENDGNFLFYLHPSTNESFSKADSIGPLKTTKTTKIYHRAYQLPIPQQRATEFVFELTRDWSTEDSNLLNPDADRLVKQGYYFLLSQVWFDYSDKAGI